MASKNGNGKHRENGEKTEELLFPEVATFKKRRFLTCFAATGNRNLAAKEAGVCTRSHRYWLVKDKQYAEAFERAQRIAADCLEEEAWRRAVRGVRRVKFDKNGEALRDPATGDYYTEHVYSDTLLIFLMKGNWPEKYQQRVKHDHKIENKSDIAGLKAQVASRLVEHLKPVAN